MKQGPLAGVRVLELATFYAAPLIATFLADHGADVVKVEPPTGDPYRTWPAMWAIVGRGKRSLALDVGQPTGRQLVHRLLPSFDVVVENLPRPLALERGLAPENLRRSNPSLVVASASGFGDTGPYAGRPANGTIGESMGGFTYLTGESDGPPLLPSAPLGDVMTGSFGAMGILAALLHRERTGQGAVVDITVFEPILHALGPALPAYRAGDAPPARDGGAMMMALRGTFRTADDGWVAISASTPRHERAAAALVGAPDLADLRHQAAAWIAARPRADVVAALVEARIPVTAVNSLADIVVDPQIAARGSLVRHGDATVAAPTPRIDISPALSDLETAAPFQAAAPGAPLPGEHPGAAIGDANCDLLGAILGLSDDQVATLRDQGVVR